MGQQSLDAEILDVLGLHGNSSTIGIPYQCNEFTINKTETGYLIHMVCGPRQYEIRVYTAEHAPGIRRIVDDAKYLVSFLVTENDNIIESGISIYN